MVFYIKSNGFDVAPNWFIFIDWLDWGFSFWLTGIFIFCLIVYIIIFFVFNKWVIFDNQPTRVIVLGKKNNKTKMITMSLLSIYRPNTEIFNKKEDALAFIKKQIN